MIGILERYLARIDRLGDNPSVIIIRHHFAHALMFNARYRDVAALQQGTSRMADRLGDSRSKAYSLSNDIYVSTFYAPKTLLEFEALKREAIKRASDTTDAYIQCLTRFAIGIEEIHRGRMTEAHEAARELMQVGRMLNDPRSTGLGLFLLSTIELAADSYAEALAHSAQSMELAVTSVDRIGASWNKGCALVAATASSMLRQAASNWPSSAQAIAKCDKKVGIATVEPVDRHAAMPDVSIGITPEALPVRASAQPLNIVKNAFQNTEPFSSAQAMASSDCAFAAT